MPPFRKLKRDTCIMIMFCKRLGFAQETLSLLDEAEEEEPEFGLEVWMSQLSYTDRARINLARALITNPEVLVVHKPALFFDDGDAKLVLDLLREHVDERGLELPKEGKRHRRPRTVFFTCAKIVGVTLADKVFEVRLKVLQ